MNKIYTASIDPASRLCGASLFDGLTLIGGQCLTSSQKTWSARAAEMRAQMKEFVLATLPKGTTVTRATIELVPKIVEPSIQLIAGAILADPIFDLNITRKQFVSPSSWKAWARRHGALDKDPKGVVSLRQTGFPVEQYQIVSDDVADSIMIFLAWNEKHGA